MNLLELQKRISEIKPDELFKEVVEETQAELADLNTEQLMSGISATGEKITPDYANPDYAKYKYSLNSKAGLGVPDLNLEGDFHSGWVVKATTQDITFNSTDSKTPKLKRMYDNIFGLTPKNLIEFAQKSFKPLYQKKVREVIGI